MSHIRTSRAGRLSALVLSGVLGLAMVITAGGFASTASAASPAVVAQTATGQTMTSAIRGTTASGRAVSGTFTPMHFFKRNGHVMARGVVDGVVHKAGPDKKFSVIRAIRVKSMNGEPIRTARAARAAAAAAVCEILHLVLGPLDLNLLGLKIHLNRVVLNIDAQPGPGNLLGNLLCSVAGLLDGGLGGLLGQLTNLLNRILGQLGLGL
jgi:hypothetical protein